MVDDFFFLKTKCRGGYLALRKPCGQGVRAVCCVLTVSETVISHWPTF